MHWVYLGCAIFGEVVGTSALKATEGFSKFWPTVLVIVGYVCAFYFLSLAIRVVPVGLAYAIWSGVGVVAIAMIGHFYYGQMLDAPALIGMALIVAGVVVIQTLSKSVV